MKIQRLLFWILIFSPISVFAQRASKGQLIVHSLFPSQFVESRNVTVWLPERYDTTRRYAVLYMHDGQMLFDSSITWNKQEWKVDETMQRLIDQKEIRETIVVGIDNNPAYRNAEYFPKAALDAMHEMFTKDIVKTWLNNEKLSDNYLAFITQELKPFIDSTYATLPDRDNTFMMGSSMGGLISIYAICSFPKLFGGVGCLSTHWSMLNPVPEGDIRTDLLFESMLSLLHHHLPSPGEHRIYFDHGTESLDSAYGEKQKFVDGLMKKRGFTEANWQTSVFEGADHSEKSWAGRLHIPLKFLLRENKE